MKLLPRFLAVLLIQVPIVSNAGELPDKVVENILGITGVRHEESKFLKLDLNYKNQAGQTLFTLRITEPKIYEVWKSGASKKLEPVSGVGEDAFMQRKLGPGVRSNCRNRGLR